MVTPFRHFPPGVQAEAVSGAGDTVCSRSAVRMGSVKLSDEPEEQKMVMHVRPYQRLEYFASKVGSPARLVLLNGLLKGILYTIIQEQELVVSFLRCGTRKRGLLI